MSDNNFKITKSGKYFRTELIRFKPANFTIKYHWSTSQLHDNRKETELYMKFVLDMEKQVKKELKKLNIDFEPLKVVVAFLKNVESWSGSVGFDIRHDIGIEKQAALLVGWYSKEYNEAKEFNDEVFARISANGKGGYPFNKKNWQEEEKYKRNNNIYELGMEELDEYYGEDNLRKSLDELTKSTQALIEQLGKKRDEENAEREEAMKDVKVGDKVLIPSSSSKKGDPDIPAVVEELMKENVVKVKVHEKLLVEVPTRMIKIARPNTDKL